MKKYLGHKKTKRGNKYNLRQNKVANGFSKVLADRKTKPSDKILHSPYTTLLMLAVYGTTDVFAKTNFNIERKTICHPKDPTFTKTILVLSDQGKKKLKGN